MSAEAQMFLILIHVFSNSHLTPHPKYIQYETCNSIPLALQYVPERDVPERDVSLRRTLIRIGPRIERDVRDRIKRHLEG